MASLSMLDSEAALRARARDHGIPDEVVDAMVGRNITSLNRVAFALTQPGTSPDETDLRAFVTLPAGDPNLVSQGLLAAARRLVFEAQTLHVAQLKQQVEGSDAKPKELPAEERRYRLSAQERRLSGMVLRGPLEVAYSAYDLVVKMLADDHITYLAPHRFSTRMLEVQQDRPSKSIVIDATQHLQVKDTASQKLQVDLPDALSLTQAMTRRSLALDLVGAATFSRAEAWNRVLVQHLQQPPPPGFKFMDTAQLLRADRAGSYYS